MAEIDGGRLFAKALKREGVEYVFTLNGGHIYNLYEGCVDEGIKVIDFRHEQVAAHAAEGWAKVTGKPGVAIVTAGPGVTDAVTGIANAFQAPSPMILIGGNAGITDHLRGGLQDFDSATFLKPVTKFSEQVKRVERIPEYVSIAFRHATSGVPGPAYLEIPIDVVGGSTDEENVKYPGSYRTESKAYGDPEYIKQVVDILHNTERPMVLAGSDIWWNDASDELREFVEMIDSPVFLNAMGRGSIPSDHPNLGSQGRRYGLVKSDTVILIGTPIDFRLGYGADSMFPQTPKLIEIMMDGSKIGQNRDIDVGVVGDSKAVLRQIMDELRATGYKSPGKGWVEEVITEDQTLKAADEGMLNSDQSPIHPMRLMKELRDVLDHDATVIGDGGDIVTFAAPCAKHQRAGTLARPGAVRLPRCWQRLRGRGAARPSRQAGLHRVRRRRLRPHRLRRGKLCPLQPAHRLHRGQQRRVEPDDARRRAARHARHRHIPLAGNRLRQDNGRHGRSRRARNRPGGDSPRPGARVQLRQACAPRRRNRPGRGVCLHGRSLPPAAPVLG